ncbi:MAG: hypothetical protein J0L93_04600 [Deltaproteobacteria bacterium]|nr:hypothetical protein [Deltaproteobacteria bacterium]
MKTYKLIFFIVFLLVGYGITKSKLDERVKHREDQSDFRLLPSPETAKILAFGFKPALADFFWIQGINYFGYELGNKNRKYTYIDDYCDLLLNLDPYFKVFYEWAGTAFIYNGLPVTPKAVEESIHFVDKGIQNLAKINRYLPSLITKGAFNFALERKDFIGSIPYFQLLARSFPDQIQYFLVASTYALYANRPEISNELKLEYFGNLAFQVQHRQELLKALQMLASTKLHEKTSEFVRAMRLQMETEEDVRKIVEQRLQDSPILKGVLLAPDTLTNDIRLKNILSINFDRTWLPPEMHVLFSL